MSDVTGILEAAQQGDPTAADQLLPLVHEQLSRLAASKMANEAPGQTLQLVHEAWLRLVGNEKQNWAGPASRRCPGPDPGVLSRFRLPTKPSI